MVAAAAFSAAISPDPLLQFAAQRYPGHRLLWVEEAVDSTVVVHEANKRLLLTINGVHQAARTIPRHTAIAGSPVPTNCAPLSVRVRC